MIWNEDISAAATPANTIHTLIQNAKVMLSERIRCTDDKHDFIGVGVTGRHTLSNIGWVHSEASELALLTWITANNPSKGCIVMDGTAIRIVDPAAPAPVHAWEVATLSHAALVDTTPTGHTQYLDVAGTGVVTTDWTLTAENQLTVTTFEATAGYALSAAHHALSWYNAHGANSLQHRHIGLTSIVTKYLDTTESIQEYSSTTIGWATYSASQIFSEFPHMVTSQLGTGISIYVFRTGTATQYQFTYAPALTLAIHMPGIRNSGSRIV